MAIRKEFSFSAGTITIIEDGVLLYKYSSGKSLSAADVIESANLRKEIIGDQPYYPIIDMRDGFVSFSKEAKKWVAENRESANVRIMDVLLVGNWGMKMEARLYLKIFHPVNETNIAMTIDEAFRIIKEHKEAHNKVTNH